MLILGSGFSTHNIHEFDPQRPASAPPPNWSAEFDDWLDRTLGAGDVDGLIDFEHTAPAASIAHPRTEHFAPLFVAMGAAADTIEDNHTAEPVRVYRRLFCLSPAVSAGLLSR